MTHPRVAVVGHVEWVRFARVPHVPRAGEIVHARDPFEEPAGGGAVAAVQLARLAGSRMLVTALGEDEHGRRAVARLGELGVQVHAARRAGPTRTAVTLVDDTGERTITTFGSRLEPPATTRSCRGLSWREMDAVYFTAGDLGALRAARAARVLVASPRALDALGHDVAAGRAGAERRRRDRAREAAPRAGTRPSWSSRTEGAEVASTGEHDRRESGSWAAAPPPGRAVDSYGCGDSFAAGLTYGLAPAWRRRMRWTWRPAAARSASPAADRTSASSRGGAGRLAAPAHPRSRS